MFPTEIIVDEQLLIILPKVELAKTKKNYPKYIWIG
jgi:hypothetical protein